MTIPDHDDDGLPRRKHRVPRLLIWVAEGIGAILAAIAIAVVILAVRLVVAPLDVGFLTPQVVAWANDRLDPYTVTIGRTRLRWQAGRSTIEVEAVDAQLYSPRKGPAESVSRPGTSVLGTDVLSVSLGLKALLHRHIQPSHVVLTRPHIALMRLDDGSIVLPGVTSPPATGGENQTADWNKVRHMMDQLGGTRQPGSAPSKGSFDRLDRISIQHASLSLDDKKIGARLALTDARILFQRSAEGWSARLTGNANAGQASSRVSFETHYRINDHHLGFSADISGFDPASWMTNIARPPSAVKDLAGVEIPFRARLDGSADLSRWALDTVRLTVRGDGGKLVDPQLAKSGLALADIDLAADYDPVARQVNLSRLTLDLNGPRIEVTGHAGPVPALFGEPVTQPIQLAADVFIRNLPESRFTEIWPETVAPNPRSWILSNLSRGTVSDLHAHVAGVWQSQQNEFVLGGINGSMKLDGFTLDYLPGLTPAHDVNASVIFDQNHFDFTILSAQLENLAITNGKAVISGLEGVSQTISIDVPIQGPIVDVIELLASDRLKLAQRAGLSPAGIGGQVAGSLHFDFPLLKDLPLAKLNYAAKADLSNLTLPKVVLGRDLNSGVLKLDLTEDLVSAAGTADLDGNHADLQWSQRLSGSSQEKMRAVVKTTLSSEARARIGLDILPDIVSGPVGTSATYIERDGGQSEADLALDLTATKLFVTDIGWSKPPGKPANATMAIQLRNERLTEVDRLKVNAPDAALEGDLAFSENDVLKHASIRTFKVLGNEAAGEVDHSGQDWDIRLHGARLDLTKYLKDLKNAKPADPGKGPVVHAAIQTDLLVLGDKRVLDHAKLDVLLHGGLSTLTLSGGVGDGKKASAVLDDPEKDGKFSLTSDDFGAVLRLAGIVDNIRGGSLSFQGENHRRDGRRIFTGHLESRDFRLLNAPVMARLLTVSSPTSIVSLLTGNGIPFDVLIGDVKFESGVLTLNKGVAHGSALGLTASGIVDMTANSIDLAGAVVPAYLLNSSLGKIPIVGDILTGGKGAGVFAVNYRLGGSLDHVQVSANPLSALAPGFIRNFFLFGAWKPAGSAVPPPTQPATSNATTPPGVR